ncbi:iron ABC transporter ATP-binding protein [Cryobacterium suzukii]|uniref:Iron ABC transporter ATP-binding protein n=1 Tax=Cryobacterium suzukii TaxID=1259198 RepID=A0A4R9AF78_9MICO|nr:iron ABC transporter ATP-binding protein [Cryobacterium suzukii]TFD58879.1 iron ABC transporter ATP-binding protein [Cryobacterium suzukii]
MTDTRVYPLSVRTATSSDGAATRRRAGLMLAGGALLALLLAGCSAADEPTPTQSAAATSGASADPTTRAEPSSSPTPTPEATGSPIAQICGDLLTLQDVYDFNPNYGTAPDYSPTADGLAETAATYNGLTCGWSNQTSGELIEVSVVAPNAVLMTTLKQQADADSQAVPTYGTPPTVDGFFTNSGGVGQAQVFTGTYWVTLSTPAFGEPGDAESLLSVILAHLG